MRKWAMSAVIVLFLCCVAGLIYAQGGGGPMHHPGMGGPGGGHGMRGQHFGPGPGFGWGPRVGGRGRVEGWPGFEEGPDVSEKQESRGESEEEVGSSEEGETESGFACPVAASRHHLLFGHARAELRHEAKAVALLLILLAVIPVLITLFWVLPVTLGVCIARRRKLTPLWMLFGICPIGGWVACLVLALSKGRVECVKCGGYVKRNFRQCPFCESALPATTPPKSPA